MKIIATLIITVCIATAFVSCGGMKNKKEMNKLEISRMDSISKEMDSTASRLEQKAQEAEQAVDDLMKDPQSIEQNVDQKTPEKPKQEIMTGKNNDVWEARDKAAVCVQNAENAVLATEEKINDFKIKLESARTALEEQKKTGKMKEELYQHKKEQISKVETLVMELENDINQTKRVIEQSKLLIEKK